MKSTLRYMPILAGALALAGWSGVAEAQTVMNMGGSSAARNMMAELPLQLCDAGQVSRKFTDATGNRINWACNRGGAPIEVRYTASNSISGLRGPDGVLSVQYLDNSTTGCTTGPVQTVGGKQFTTTTCPDGTNLTAPEPMHLGVSDVQAKSFGQVGPLGTAQPDYVFTNGVINPVRTMVVPFSIYLGAGVTKIGGGQVDNLSRLEVEQLFGRNITDWGQLGFTPGPVQICARTAGSGTFAALDQTLLINTTHTPIASTAAGAEVTFNASTSGVVSCLASRPRAIAYMDADQIRAFLPGGSNPGAAYAVAVDGGRANDTTLADRKRDLKCGKYAYWTYLQFFPRIIAPVPPQPLTNDFISIAQSAASIPLLPPAVANFWEADENMFVSKNADAGPLQWKAGAHPQCQ